MLYQAIRDAPPDVLGLQEALRSQLDDLRGALPDEAPVGTFHGFSGDEDGEMIDFIFAQPAPVTEVLMAQIIREHRDGLYPSDHFPVAARLRLQP